VFVITRVSGRCGAVSIDLDELITEHYRITRAELAPELESLPSIRPQAAAPSSTPSPTTLQRFSRDAPQTRRVGAGCGRSHPAAQPTKLVETGVGTPSPARHVVAHSSVLGRMRIAVRSGSLAGSASATRRARSQLIRAARISRLLDQAPARMCQAYADRRSPAASRCSAIRAALSPTESWSRCSMTEATRRWRSARSDLSCAS